MLGWVCKFWVEFDQNEMIKKAKKNIKLGKWPKKQKITKKWPKTSLKRLICITKNPPLNNILMPFKDNLNHTKNGQKRQKVAKIHRKVQKIGKKRPKTTFKHLSYVPIGTPWSMLHWSPSQNPGQLCLLRSQWPINTLLRKFLWTVNFFKK